MAEISVIEAVRQALKEEMSRDSKVFVLGEDVGVRGGVFLATDGFVEEFGDGLLASLNRSHPPVYDGEANPRRQAVMAALKRAPFPEQAEVVQAISALLLDRHEPAGIINAEMGTGKTMMAIATAAGMFSSTLLTLLVVPVFYVLFDDAAEAAKRGFRRLFGDRDESGVALPS